jgi:hypothetical protein
MRGEGTRAAVKKLTAELSASRKDTNDLTTESTEEHDCPRLHKELTSPKSRILARPALVTNNVGRFDVALNNALAVCPTGALAISMAKDIRLQGRGYTRQYGF